MSTTSGARLRRGREDEHLRSQESAAEQRRRDGVDQRLSGRAAHSGFLRQTGVQLRQPLLFLGRYPPRRNLAFQIQSLGHVLVRRRFVAHQAEQFMESTHSWLSELKLRATYGTQGNEDLANYYPYTDQYTVTISEGKLGTGIYYYGNPDLTWEKGSRTFDLGLDVGLLNDRINLTMDYFIRVSERSASSSVRRIFRRAAPTTGTTSANCAIRASNST